jgi:putative chitinase
MAFPVTLYHLSVAGVSQPRAEIFIGPLNAAMLEYDINVSERPAMFLAQVAHESSRFQYVEEIWGPTYWQLKYPDGQLFKGRGLIQITGRKNYEAVAEHFGFPLEAVAAWLVTPEGACRASAHWWQSNECNEISDRFEFVALTRRINGPGMLGLQQRTYLYHKIAEAMQQDPQ